MVKIAEVKISKCPICMSKNNFELYPANLDFNKFVLTYESEPECQKNSAKV